ncbi:MAG: hypothetical protein U9Q67_01725 [Patescibacteria group bacterium]|nr:hypothetical protein [Patescibacteria group bacterium]
MINFAKQKYDKTRAEYDRKKKRPTKGKIYHLVIINYYGPSDLPVAKDLEKSFIMDYKWVDYKEGLELVRLSTSLRREDPESYSKKSIEFNISLFKKCIRARRIVDKAFLNGKEQQVSMF